MRASVREDESLRFIKELLLCFYVPLWGLIVGPAGTLIIFNLSMNKTDVVCQRLHNQKLSSSEFTKPVAVVRWLGAMQAQDFNAAKWALGLRMRTATNALIEEAFNRGEILRTHLLRPTWHFVAPADIRWLLQLTAPRVNLRCGPNYRKYELDAATFKRSQRVLTKALQGGKHLTRATLKTVLNEAGVAADDPVRLAHILLRAELDGLICSGPRVGKQFTYALLEERVPATRAIDRDEALAELTRRYFRSHGPATLQDYIWWSGLTSADAKRGIELVDRELREVLLEHTAYFTRPLKTVQNARPSAHLLPAFDEYFLAYKDRRLLFASQLKLTTWDLLGPTIIVNGTVAGTWKLTDNKNSVNAAWNPSRNLNKSEQLAIMEAANRYAHFNRAARS
jgi:hypothetical protein